MVIDTLYKPLVRLLAIGFVLTLGDGRNSGGCEPEQKMALPSEFQKLAPLHTRLGKPQPGDWLAEHPETGQSYLQFQQLIAFCTAHGLDREREFYEESLARLTAVSQR